MKSFLLLLSLALLASCATVPRPTEADLEARVRSVLDGPSLPAPVELTIDPDYLGERWTLVRTRLVVKITSMPDVDRPNEDSPLGLSFGNGLYLDSSNNLAVRIDRLAGVGPDYRGTTEYWAEKPGAPGTGVQAEYAEDGIDVFAPGKLFSRYRIDTAGDTISALGTTLVPIDEGYRLATFYSASLVATKNGVRKSWFRGFELSLSGQQRTLDFILGDGRVADRGKTFVVEHKGEYVRVRYGLAGEHIFRLYRTPTTTVVVNEANGGLLILRTSPGSVEWQTVRPGVPAPEFQAEGRFKRSAS